MRDDVTTEATLVPELSEPRPRLHAWRGQLMKEIRNN